MFDFFLIKFLSGQKFKNEKKFCLVVYNISRFKHNSSGINKVLTIYINYI